ncbi:19060_t:CDS:2, partial [Gigaspora margarita]
KVLVDSNENPPMFTKELQMTWKVDDLDVMHKISRAKSWLAKGYQRSTEKERIMDRSIMNKILNELKDYSKEIHEPKWIGESVIL